MDASETAVKAVDVAEVVVEPAASKPDVCDFGISFRRWSIDRATPVQLKVTRKPRPRQNLKSALVAVVACGSRLGGRHCVLHPKAVADLEADWAAAEGPAVRLRCLTTSWSLLP